MTNIDSKVEEPSGENVVRVTRHRKRRRSSANKNRPWYKSKRLRYRLEIAGKMVMAVTLMGIVGVLVYVIAVYGWW